MNKKLIYIATITCGLIAFALISCSRKSGEPQMFTDQSIAAVQLMYLNNATNVGKTKYAILNREWISWCYDDFRKWLGSGQYGVIRWDDRSQCTLFASAFEVYVQLAFFRQAFHSSIQATGAGVGTIWYLVNPNLAMGTPGNGHALNVVMTQNGQEYFEPQTGKFVFLTAEQEKSRMLKKFD